MKTMFLLLVLKTLVVVLMEKTKEVMEKTPALAASAVRCLLELVIPSTSLADSHSTLLQVVWVSALQFVFQAA